MFTITIIKMGSSNNGVFDFNGTEQQLWNRFVCHPVRSDGDQDEDDEPIIFLRGRTQRQDPLQAVTVDLIQPFTRGQEERVSSHLTIFRCKV